MLSLGSADATDPPARGKNKVFIYIFRRAGGSLALRPPATPFTASRSRHRSSRLHLAIRRFGNVSLKSAHVGLYHPRFVTLAR